MLTAVLSRSEVLANIQALHLLNEVRQVMGSAHASHLQSTGELVLRISNHPQVPLSTVVTVSAQRSLMQVYRSQHLEGVFEASALLDISRSIFIASVVDRLAPVDIQAVAIVGGGESAKQVLKALRLVRSIERTALYQADLAASTQLKFQLKAALDAAVSSADSVGEAIENADVIVVNQGNDLPFTEPKRGALLVVHDDGSMAQRTLPSWLQSASVFSDGSVPALLGAQFLTLDDVNAVAQRNLTKVFVTSVPSWLDAVAGWHVLQGALQNQQVTRIALEA
jgi:hypothetical protein